MKPTWAAVAPQDRVTAIIVLALVLVLSLALLAVARLRDRADARMSHELRRLCSGILVYDVPSGQRAADVLRALDWAGYTAAQDTTPGSCRVLVSCPGEDVIGRQVVRGVIEAVPPALHIAVRFADES